jgi:hypothetical protein
VKRGDVIRVTATVVSLALLLSHLFFPAVARVDAITLALLAVAIVPWLGDVFESIDLPGGGGVKFRETVKAAGEVVVASAPAPRPSPPAPALEQPPHPAAPAPGPSRAARHEPLKASVLPLSSDPNLALVALRIEIEKRLAALVEKAGVKARSLNDMLRAADELHLLDARVIDALRTLIRAGNMAAHGRPIDRELGEWVSDTGPDILRALDLRLQAPDLP